MKTVEQWVKKFADRHGPHVVHYEILPALIESIQKDAWEAATEAQMEIDKQSAASLGEDMCLEPFPSEAK